MRLSFNYHRSAALLFLLSGCIGTDIVDELIGPDLSDLVLDKNTLSLMISGESKLNATYYDTNGSPAMAALTWTSSIPSVAVVNEDGVVRGIDKGQSWVVVSANTKKDSCLVNVLDDLASVASVDISGAKNQVALNEKLQLTTIVRDGNGDILNNYIEEWSSNDPMIASIDMNGLVEGLSPGFTSIVARVDGVNSVPFQLTVGDGARDGMFEGKNGYNASGTVVIVNSGGDYTVQLQENFMTTSGPGLHVYLAKSADTGANGADLGALKAIKGLQDYPVPEFVDPDEYTHVLIYCQPFSVVFAAATIN